MNKFVANLKAHNNGPCKLSSHANKVLMTTILCTVLSACSKDDIDESIDDAEKNRTSDIYFVNSLDETATFYVKNGLMVNDLFKSQFDRGDVAKNSVSNVFRYDWNDNHDDTEFGVRDTVSLSESAKLTHDLKNNTDFWSIAWNSDGNNPRYKLSVIEKRASNQSNVFSIRVFANSEMAIRINDSNNIVANTEAGKVTSVFRIENCATGLKIDNNFIDLCQGEFGKSYLIIADKNGKRVMVQE